MSKVLVNLANMTENQLKAEAGAKAQAAQYREKLVKFLADNGLRRPEDTCAICLDKMPIKVGGWVLHVGGWMGVLV